MYRRRRGPAREPVFGFDCFLDVVTNVVGIIIRLILVAWVGARAYTGLKPADTPETATAAKPAPRPADDPLHAELARMQRDLDNARGQLLEHLRGVQDIQGKMARTEYAVALTESDRQSVQAQRSLLLEKERAVVPPPPAPAPLPPPPPELAELRQRSRAVAEEIQALEKMPTLKKTLRYHAPVSRLVQAEELMFECKAGRVTFIDLAAFIDDVKRGMEAKADLLKTQWEATDIAGPIGAFRLRYTIERQRGVLEGGGTPPDSGNFRYGLAAWVLEPISSLRGENRDQALAAGSEFRQILDGQDLRTTVVTFWVYPDSFALYRELRDYLYERGAEVAARPLPDALPIAGSRHGTASRGQ